MKKHLSLILSGSLLLLFIIFTVLVAKVDVQSIGPNGSTVGFAGFNDWCHKEFGTNMELYTFTDYFSLLAVPVGGCFAIMGVIQLIKRKNLLKVDGNILALGIFYVLVFVSYVLFEKLKINYRPILIEGELEASYPSSTTVLALTIFVTAIDQIVIYIKDLRLRNTLIIFDSTFCLYLVIGRILSGVHWMTDIIGGVLLSAALICGYFALKKLFIKEKTEE